MHPSEPKASELATATFVVIAIILISFILAPQRNPSELVRGVPCSVLSETEIGAVLGTHVQLEPTSGNICRYVSTDRSDERNLIVVAKRDTELPATWGEGSNAGLQAAGSALVRHGDTLYVRKGSRSYLLIVLPHTADGELAFNQEMRLAARLASSGRIANR